jgi:hypothetical protein
MRERNSSENTSVDVIIILKFNLKNWDLVLDWIGLICHRIGTNGWLMTRRFIKKGSAP